MQIRHQTFLVAVLVVTPFIDATAQQRLPVQPSDRGHIMGPIDTVTGQRPAFEPGTLIRLNYCVVVLETPECREDEGRIVALTADSVQLHSDFISFASITKLEVGTARPDLIVGGAILGSLLGAWGAVRSIAAEPDYEYRCTRGIAGLSGRCRRVKNSGYVPLYVVGAIGVGILGGVLASQIKRWEEVPLDQLSVTFVPQRDGRFAFGLSVAF